MTKSLASEIRRQLDASPSKLTFRKNRRKLIEIANALEAAADMRKRLEYYMDLAREQGRQQGREE